MKMFCTTVVNGKIPKAVSLQIGKHLEGLEDGPVDVIVMRPKKKRTTDQNAYWWGVVIPAVSQHCGYERHEADQVHEDVVMLLMPELATERVNKITGELTTVRASTSDMDTATFSDLMERAWRWAAVDLGIVIPSPGEFAQNC